MPVQKLSTAFGTDTSIPLEFDSETVQKYLDSKAGQGTFRGEWTHGKSVSSAYWDPRGRSVVSTSYDDQLRCEAHCFSFTPCFVEDDGWTVWDLDTAKFNKSSTAVIPKPFSSIKHDCQTVHIPFLAWDVGIEYPYNRRGDGWQSCVPNGLLTRMPSLISLLVIWGILWISTLAKATSSQSWQTDPSKLDFL